jgi:peptidoglycan hydrolase-like protein with peptidoglycan-binding domain
MNMRRTASALSVAAVIAAGLTFASPGIANAASSCTNITLYQQQAPLFDDTAAVPTIGLNTGQANCLLSNGNSSIAVSELQISLNCYSAISLTVDGIYGPQTQAAVEYVQSHNGISVDGIYGPQTRNVMLWSDTARTGCAKLKQPLTRG